MRGGKNKMNNLFKNAQSRSELVATFLAVLELCKANRVHLDGEGDDLEISMIGRKKQ
jgi:segregation and condensation protein A